MRLGVDAFGQARDHGDATGHKLLTESPCARATLVGGVARADDRNRAGVLAAQLAAVEQKRTRATKHPQVRGILTVEHGHQPRSDVRLRRANRLARTLHMPIEGRQPPRESAPSRLTGSRPLGDLALKQTWQPAGAKRFAGDHAAADALDRAQREQSEVDVAAEIERGVAVAVGRRQEW